MKTGGGEMTEAVGTDPIDAPTRRRVPMLGIVAGCLLLIASAALWVRVGDPFNPYRSGTSHTVTLIYNAPCQNGWSTHIDDGSRHYTYAEGTAPMDWRPGPVTGILHILSSWAGDGIGTDAVFEAQGQEVSLTGGRDDRKHFFSASCSTDG
jgi:hypothetical protein